MRTLRPRHLKPIRVILAAALVVFLIAWGSLIFQTGLVFSVDHGGSYEVHAVFDEVDGLAQGGDVNAGGVRVGRVSSISLSGPDLLPHVTLQLEKSFRLHQGATADLRLYSNAGELNRYIEITQGHGAELPSGSTIGISYTNSPVEFDQVLQVLNGPTRKAVDQALAGLDGATIGQGANFQQVASIAGTALAQTSNLLGQLNSDGTALRTAIDDGSSVVAAMNRDPASLGSFADQLGGLLTTTAARQSDLAATAQSAVAGLKAPRVALERVDAAVPALRALIPVARAAVSELPATTRALRPTLGAARPALAQAEQLVTSAPADLRALTPVLATAGDQLPSLTHIMCTSGPILDDLRASTPDVVGAAQLFGSIAANYDANGHAARVFVNTPRVLGGTDTEDTDQEGLLVKPYVRAPGANEGQAWTNFRSSFIGGNGVC
jgi:phospholipid/cholesterol/gamma-HCH transport system substrate-binding protein